MAVDLLVAFVQWLILLLLWGGVLIVVGLWWLFGKKHRHARAGEPRAGAREVYSADEATSDPESPCSASGRGEPQKPTAASKDRAEDPSKGAARRPKREPYAHEIDPGLSLHYGQMIYRAWYGEEPKGPELRRPSSSPADPARIDGGLGNVDPVGGPLSRQEIQRLRTNHARSKERVRSALYGLLEIRNPEGWSVFYVFDEIATDSAGIADQVAVGPWGICAILVYDLPEGKVTLDSRSDQYMLNGRYFKEDLNERGTALVDELRQSIFGDPTAPVYYLVCFTSVGAEVGERKDYPRDAAYSVWELTRCLIGSEPVFSQGDLDKLATRIRRRYDRQPYIRPNQRVDGSADAREEDSAD